MKKKSPLQIFQNKSKGKFHKFVSPLVIIELETRQGFFLFHNLFNLFIIIAFVYFF